MATTIHRCAVPFGRPASVEFDGQTQRPAQTHDGFPRCRSRTSGVLQSSRQHVQRLGDLPSGKIGAQAVVRAAAEGHRRAELAIRVFIDRVKKFIGAYAAILNGVDALVFTAGLGENSPLIRSGICESFDYLKLWIDPEKNDIRGQEADISTKDSQVRILVIPTNEELMIALETYQLVRK